MKRLLTLMAFAALAATTFAPAGQAADSLTPYTSVQRYEQSIGNALSGAINVLGVELAVKASPVYNGATCTVEVNGTLDYTNLNFAMPYGDQQIDKAGPVTLATGAGYFIALSHIIARVDGDGICTVRGLVTRVNY